MSKNVPILNFQTDEAHIAELEGTLSHWTIGMVEYIREEMPTWNKEVFEAHYASEYPLNVYVAAGMVGMADVSTATIAATSDSMVSSASNGEGDLD